MVIVADSALQLEQETIRRLGLAIVDYPMFLNGDPYPVSMAMGREEKDALRLILKDKDKKVTTSGLREEDLLRAYRGAKGDKVLSIHQSGKASTATSALIRKVIKDNPDLDVTFIDSGFLAAAYSVLVQRLAESVAQGKGFEAAMADFEAARSATRHLGVVYDLFYLHRTGRIGLVKAVLGTAMKIVSLLGSNGTTGEIKAIGKVKNYSQANEIFLGVIRGDLLARSGKALRAVISLVGPHEEEARDLKNGVEGLPVPAKVEIHYTNHSNMPHVGPDYYDIGYTVVSD
jgi:DegV family protein with EDD domain